jgi:UDP-2,3-diacylglucosamine pyrophosphatase LpxH
MTADDDGLLHFRTIWISDLHLGTAGCQAKHLLDFLRCTESATLYLVGDIVDGWQLRRRWYWPQTHNDVVQKVLRKARKGTRVVYIPGNHDEFGRHFLKLSFGGIEVCDEAVHVTADGRRLLVLHGDLFDAVVQQVRWLAIVGDRLHTAILHLNRWLNAMRARLGFPYWSLAQYLKLKVKDAVSYMTAFERAVAAEAKRRDVDGVVCGHIHCAEIRDIESLTALVENDRGELRILRWHEVANLAKHIVADDLREEKTIAYIGRD